MLDTSTTDGRRGKVFQSATGRMAGGGFVYPTGEGVAGMEQKQGERGLLRIK